MKQTRLPRDFSALHASEPEPERTVSGVAFRDALSDRDDVQSDLMASGSDGAAPFVTIAIPTYRRPELLAETVRSALALRFDRPVEVLVVDNDPDGDGHRTLLKRLPELAHASFRYYRHQQNIGAFPNWNRGIRLARGEWISVLNDDDLLVPDFLQQMFEEIVQHHGTDGIVCQKALLDERLEPDAPPSQLMMMRMRLMMMLKFGRARSRRVKPDKLFWGAVLGNTAGFLFRAATAREIGGFYPEDSPSADYWFYLRFMLAGQLRQHRERLATIRMTEDSATPNLVAELLRQGARLQALLPGRLAPSWYRRVHPLMLERHRVEFRELWGVDVPKAELEQAVGMRLPQDNKARLELIRLAIRGF